MHNSPLPKFTSAWVSFAQQTIQKTGRLSAQDLSGKSLIFEWTVYDPTSPQFTQAIKNVSEVFAQTYTNQEVEFARKRPEAVPTEPFLKSVAPLFKHGIDKVDWKNVEKHVRSTMDQFFSTNDFAKWASPNDLAIFVIAKDIKEETSLGAIQFSITPDYVYGTVRVGLTGILSSVQNRGLEKLLMSSIFKLLPDVSRLFLHNRPTNERALAQYLQWGFIHFDGTNPDWPDFEYLAESSTVLQNAAATFDLLH